MAKDDFSIGKQKKRHQPTNPNLTLNLYFTPTLNLTLTLPPLTLNLTRTLTRNLFLPNWRHASPSKLTLETLAKSAPVLTPETAR